MKTNIFYNKDSSIMDEVPDHGVDLIISGPPYWDYIDYQKFIENPGGEGHVWNNESFYGDFLKKLKA